MDLLPTTVELCIAEFTGHHERWNIRACGGQNNLCARAWNQEDWFSGCSECNALWYLKNVSCRWKVAVLDHAKQCKVKASTHGSSAGYGNGYGRLLRPV